MYEDAGINSIIILLVKSKTSSTIENLKKSDKTNQNVANRTAPATHANVPHSLARTVCQQVMFAIGFIVRMTYRILCLCQVGAHWLHPLLGEGKLLPRKFCDFKGKNKEIRKGNCHSGVKFCSARQEKICFPCLVESKLLCFCLQIIFLNNTLGISTAIDIGYADIV